VKATLDGNTGVVPAFERSDADAGGGGVIAPMRSDAKP